jgi:hypothetical protein
MITAITIFSLAGAVGSAQLCWKYIKPWHLAAQAQGDARYRRARKVTPWCVAGAFFAGLFGTAFILHWLVQL